VLVNIARGQVFDEDAMVAALRSGRQGGAVLDLTWLRLVRISLGDLGEGVA